MPQVVNYSEKLEQIGWEELFAPADRRIPLSQGLLENH